MMQQRQADVLKYRIVFLDPAAISESRHLGPMCWKDIHDELSKYKMRKKKQAKRIYEHKEIIKRVGVYISLQMQHGKAGMSYGHHITSSKCSFNH
jgi:hypothetical protein